MKQLFKIFVMSMVIAPLFVTGCCCKKREVCCERQYECMTGKMVREHGCK